MPRNTMNINPKWAERLNVILNEQEISQKDFAKRIHISPQLLSKIKNGKATLTPGTAKEICKEFPVYRESWLLGYDDFKTDNGILLDSVFQKKDLDLLMDVLYEVGYLLIPDGLRVAYDPPLPVDSRVMEELPDMVEETTTHPSFYIVKDMLLLPPEYPDDIVGRISYEDALDLAKRIKQYSRWEVQRTTGTWRLNLPLENKKEADLWSPLIGTPCPE